MSENIKKKDVPVITKGTIKRIIDDVKYLIKEPLHDIGIFYQHDEEDMLKGHAMIIGPEDSCYEHGFYFFKFVFPHDYPFRPPKVQYLTNDGATRFHPNLYRDGKVCLSVLNTWKGEGWSACQSIQSILIIIQSILNNTPLLHEPGITNTHRDFNNYNKIITFRNFEFAVMAQSTPKYLSSKNYYWIGLFRTHLLEYLEKNKFKIRDRMIQHKESIKEILTLTTSVYHLSAKIDYDSLINTWNSVQCKYVEKDRIINDTICQDNICEDKPIKKRPIRVKQTNKIVNNKNDEKGVNII